MSDSDTIWVREKVSDNPVLVAPDATQGGRHAPWFSPAALDREHWRWRGMRRQKGGWDQALWVRVQDEWRRALHEE